MDVWGRGGSPRAARGGVERRPGSRRAVARAPLSPVGPQLRPLWGGGVRAARAGWGRAADVREGGAHLFSRPPAFSRRFPATAALGPARSLVGARCARRKVGPNSGPRSASAQAPTSVRFLFSPGCPRGCGDGKRRASRVSLSWDPTRPVR